MRGNAEITGYIVAEEVIFGGNADVYYENPEIGVSNIVVTYIGTSYKKLNWNSK